MVGQELGLDTAKYITQAAIIFFILLYKDVYCNSGGSWKKGNGFGNIIPINSLSLTRPYSGYYEFLIN